MPRSYAPLDLKAIHFPSDRLSIGNLRRLHPELFDQGEALSGIAYFGDSKQTSALALLINQERAFAIMVYKNALCDRPLNTFEPDAGNPTWDGEDLIDRWQSFGLVAGTHEGQMMLRSITQAAFAQAQQQLGSGRV